MIRGHHRSDASAPTRAQIGFFWVVVLHLTERGVMDVDLLYEPPFTDHAPHRPDDLFRRLDPPQAWLD